jgi:hypothetical protein
MNISKSTLSIFLAGIAVISGCQQPNQQKSNEPLTRNDSIAIARAIKEDYPDSANNERMARSMPESAASPLDADIKPPAIQWEDVLAYKAKYDAAPVMRNSSGDAIKGFMVNEETYRYLLANKDIKGLYIRLAKNPANDYTLLLLGTDETGRLLVTSKEQEVSSSYANFNYLGTCPTLCPLNFDNE